MSKQFKKLSEEFGANIPLYEMKFIIRRCVGEGLSIPPHIREEIVYQINNGPVGSWNWAILAFLSSDEKRIKEAIKKRILVDRCMGTKGFFNILMSSVISIGERNIFIIEEGIKEGHYFVNINYLGKDIISIKETIEDGVNDNPDESYYKSNTRIKAIEKLFEFFS